MSYDNRYDGGLHCELTYENLWTNIWTDYYADGKDIIIMTGAIIPMYQIHLISDYFSGIRHDIVA